MFKEQPSSKETIVPGVKREQRRVREGRLERKGARLCWAVQTAGLILAAKKL